MNQNLLSCITRHPEHNKMKIDMAESEEVFEDVFGFSVKGKTFRKTLRGRKLLLAPST